MTKRFVHKNFHSFSTKFANELISVNDSYLWSYWRSFLCIAVLAVEARGFIRIRTRRFGLDDYLVLFAIVCLSTSTGVLIKYTRILFIMEAVLFDTVYIYTTED